MATDSREARPGNPQFSRMQISRTSQRLPRKGHTLRQLHDGPVSEDWGPDRKLSGAVVGCPLGWLEAMGGCHRADLRDSCTLDRGSDQGCKVTLVV